MRKAEALGAEEQATMTKLLEQAIAQASTLSEADQDSLAGRWISDLTDEQGWQERFVDSQDVLARLGEEAFDEYRSGLTERLDPNQDERSSFDRAADLIGCVSGGPPDLSEQTGKKFRELLLKPAYGSR